jgi:hypothetical protein
MFLEFSNAFAVTPVDAATMGLRRATGARCRYVRAASYEDALKFHINYISGTSACRIQSAPLQVRPVFTEFL